MTLSCLVKISAVILFTPVYFLPAVFFAVVGTFIGSVYIKAQIAVKREMSIAKAPVLGVFGGAIAGLRALLFQYTLQILGMLNHGAIASIRAYGAQGTFRGQLRGRIDRYTRAARSFHNVTRCVPQTPFARIFHILNILCVQLAQHTSRCLRTGVHHRPRILFDLWRYHPERFQRWFHPRYGR